MTNPFFESTYPEELYVLSPKTFVVISTPWENATEAERQQLVKILAAIKLNLESVRIIVQSELNLSTWIEKPKKVICFSPASSTFKKYEVIEADGTALVLSNPLAELIQDDASKRKLWLALKQLFSV
ncbi:MAG: hypothetical protein AABY93_17190 [Bacteroidota bacterium]